MYFRNLLCRVLEKLCSNTAIEKFRPGDIIPASHLTYTGSMEKFAERKYPGDKFPDGINGSLIYTGYLWIYSDNYWYLIK